MGEPSGFGVSEAGVISTSRHFSLAAQGKVEVVVYARDQRSKQVWKTKVHLHAAPLQVTQQDMGGQCLKGLQMYSSLAEKCFTAVGKKPRRFSESTQSQILLRNILLIFCVCVSKGAI